MDIKGVVTTKCESCDLPCHHNDVWSEKCHRMWSIVWKSVQISMFRYIPAVGWGVISNCAPDVGDEFFTKYNSRGCFGSGLLRRIYQHDSFQIPVSLYQVFFIILTEVTFRTAEQNENKTAEQTKRICRESRKMDDWTQCWQTFQGVDGWAVTTLARLLLRVDQSHLEVLLPGNCKHTCATARAYLQNFIKM